jgi:hypothetical protein
VTFTFNAKGEYTLIETTSQSQTKFELQGRFEQIVDNDGKYFQNGANPKITFCFQGPISWSCLRTKSSISKEKYASKTRLAAQIHMSHSQFVTGILLISA